VVAGHFPVLKYATRNWQLASYIGKHDHQAADEEMYVCEFRSFLIGKREEKEYLSRCYRLFFRKVSESQQHFIFIYSF